MRPIKSLKFADIFRDGGSYEAWFETVDGTRLVIYLEAHPKSPGRGSLRHARLFAYEGEEMPADATPIRKKSEAEDELLRELDAFLRQPRLDSQLSAPRDALERLTQMVSYIPKREDA